MKITRTNSLLSILILSIPLLFMACSPAMQVSYDYDSSVNLRQFKTFKIEPERGIKEDPLLGSDLNKRRLMDAVTEVMLAKGYKLDEQNPELVVAFMTDVKDRQQVRSNNNYSPYWWWYGPMANNVSTYNYQETRFIVNIYQTELDRMIWQGWASGKAKTSNKKEDRDQTMKNIIADILYSFPQATNDVYSGRK